MKKKKLCVHVHILLYMAIYRFYPLQEEVTFLFPGCPPATRSYLRCMCLICPHWHDGIVNKAIPNQWQIDIYIGYIIIYILNKQDLSCGHVLSEHFYKILRINIMHIYIFITLELYHILWSGIFAYQIDLAFTWSSVRHERWPVGRWNAIGLGYSMFWVTEDFFLQDLNRLSTHSHSSDLLPFIRSGRSCLFSENFQFSACTRLETMIMHIRGYIWIIILHIAYSYIFYALLVIIMMLHGWTDLSNCTHTYTDAENPPLCSYIFISFSVFHWRCTRAAGSTQVLSHIYIPINIK